MLIEVILANMPDSTSGLVVTSARHQQKLKQAIKAMRSAYRNTKAGTSPEMTAFDLRQAAGAIDEITGRVYNEEILGKIFSRFCIGK